MRKITEWPFGPGMQVANGMTVALIMMATVLLIVMVNAPPAPQKEWGCRPQPGYCDIDTDNAEWRRHN